MESKRGRHHIMSIYIKQFNLLVIHGTPDAIEFVRLLVPALGKPTRSKSTSKSSCQILIIRRFISVAHDTIKSVHTQMSRLRNMTCPVRCIILDLAYCIVANFSLENAN